MCVYSYNVFTLNSLGQVLLHLGNVGSTLMTHEFILSTILTLKRPLVENRVLTCYSIGSPHYQGHMQVKFPKTITSILQIENESVLF